jgi:hypothetical protein
MQRELRPNPSLKLSPNGVAHWASGAGASRPFCAAGPARHTAGPTLARTLGLTQHAFRSPPSLEYDQSIRSANQITRRPSRDDRQHLTSGTSRLVQIAVR